MVERTVMSAPAYYEKISAVLEAIHRTQAEKLAQAGEAMTAAIAAGRGSCCGWNARRATPRFS
jgi:hypothetical protein